MKIANAQKRILVGYGAAYALLLLAFVLTFAIKDGAGGSIRMVPYYAALAFVIHFTFAWGRLGGFPSRSDDGHLVLSHIVRNLTMSAIVWIALIAVSASALPWIMGLFE